VDRPRTTALLTDRYELSMLASFLADGSAERPAVFECFARHLPPGRRYGVVAGLGRLVDLLEGFRFEPAEVDWLVDEGVVPAAYAQYLRELRPVWDVDAYREGEVYVPGSPVLTVRGPLGQALVLETLVLSVLNHDSAIASAAARMDVASRGRPLVEMGARRTHEDAAVAAARAAYVAGFASTSDLEAGRRYGIPTVGTAAHAFVLAHESERAAFASQVEALGPGTTLLVDTYDIAEGIRTAVEVAGTGLGGVRIDSGVLADEVRRARALLDELGATGTRITVTSDLDEYGIEALADCPADVYGVGTRIVTGSGHPTVGFVYKLVAIGDDEGGALRPVHKTSVGKANAGGAKSAYRLRDERSCATGELLVVGGSNRPPDRARPLQVPVVRHGTVVHRPSLDEVRAHHRAARGELPDDALDLADGDPVFEAVVAAG
jgi:nicotinate phosphoribosyltransferase